MKKITIIYLMLFSIVFVSCKESAASKIKTSNLENAEKRDAVINLGSAIIEFDKKEFDFGTIKQGEVVEGTFLISNKGKTDLIITSAKASCGCTVPEWPKDPIKPGESSIMKFKFDSKGKSGKQNKSITIKANTENVTEVLRVKGTIEVVKS
jgi:hypothetical protein